MTWHFAEAGSPEPKCGSPTVMTPSFKAVSMAETITEACTEEASANSAVRAHSRVSTFQHVACTAGKAAVGRYEISGT